MDLTKYEKIFIQESENYLKDLDDLLMEAEKDLGNREIWQEIFGKIHSIKGMARALSLEKTTGLTHAMENWCKQFQEGSSKATGDTVQILMDGGEVLRALVAGLDKLESSEAEEWYQRLMSRLQKGSEEPPGERGRKKRLSSPSATPVKKIDYIRVKYSLIEELLGLSQEILLLEKTLPPLPQAAVSAGLKNWINHYTSMLKGLYFRLAQLRLMPVGDFADLFGKTIRDLAKQHGREVTFEVAGGEVQADLTLLERLREPFVHLFRNAVAHGIEPREERIKAGKSPGGKLVMEARSEKGHLIIKISDDGQGIKESAIVDYLKGKKALTDEQIRALPEQEFFNTILQADFSTAGQATDMAGRGIGMNVVAQAIKDLGGSLNIRSTPYKGAQFLLKLPVSLSVIYTVTFRVGEYTLSVPTSSVASIDRGNDPVDEDSPLYDLRSMLGVGHNGHKPFHILNLKHPDQEKVGEKEGEPLKGLIVDRIIGNTPLMIMPSGELLARAGVFAGVGIMENGEISLLLNLGSLPETPSRGA